jgi:hypothetical protein
MTFRTLVLRGGGGQDFGMKQSVVVYGANGHTGRFVVAELRERGYVPVLSGRRPMGEGFRVATVDDPSSLDRALADAAAVINCAGPFGATAGPVIEAASRAGIPYVDTAAEIEVLADMFSTYADSESVIVPAAAFYGGLGDLLATVAMGDWVAADEVHIAYGLSSWHPTPGTRAAGALSRARRNGRRVRYTNGRLSYTDGELPRLEWPFPTGPRPVLGEFSMADVVTVPSHLAVPEVQTYMSVEAARDVSSPDTPAPAAVDALGRSAQTFVVDVVVCSGGEERRAVASGQDIYAVSAPIAVEAVHRALTGQTRATGIASTGKMFDAADFLNALSKHITLTEGPSWRRGESNP